MDFDWIQSFLKSRNYINSNILYLIDLVRSAIAVSSQTSPKVWWGFLTPDASFMKTSVELKIMNNRKYI